MLQSWVLFPVALGLISLGWGLGVERLAGRRLPGELILPVGFAAMLAVSRLVAATYPLVRIATVLVVVVAVAGLLARRKDRSFGQIDRPLTVAAVAVFAVFAAPIVLTGSATFAGYGVLGDTAVQFVLTDALFHHAGDVSGLGASAYKSTVEGYKAAAYPLGTHAALGAVRPLAFTDVAWVYQPFLAFLMLLQALVLAALLRPLIASRRLLALVAFVVAQPALVYSFALQGSIKELATLMLVPLLVALVPWLGRRSVQARGRWALVREVVPLAAAAAAMVAAAGPGAAVWLAPTSLVALVLLARRQGWRVGALVLPTLGFVVLLAVLSLPTLGPLTSSVSAQGDVLTAQNETGNLVGPLELRQLVGTWLSNDYRISPGTGLRGAITLALVLVGLGLTAGGVFTAARARSIGPVLYAGVSLLVLAVVLRTGSPWAEAKALAIASPAVLLLVAVGFAGLRDRLAPAAWVLGSVMLAGVVASNVLAYRSSSPAPRDRLEELAHVEKLTSGRGPMLSTEFEEYTKHFVRDGRPVGAFEVGTPGLQPGLVPGVKLKFGNSADLDQLVPGDVLRFPAILTRRSPVRSRPPASYRLAWSGRYYELWRRRSGIQVREHLPLGTRLEAGARPVCGQVAALAARFPGGTLVAYPPPRDALADVARASKPSTWVPRDRDLVLLGTLGGGRLRTSLTVGTPGTHRLWLLGSFGRTARVYVDGREVGKVSRELAQPAGWLDLGEITLRSGTHRVEIERVGNSLAPANGDANRTLGPLAATSVSSDTKPVRIPAARWRELCGRTFDWIEAVS